MTNVMITIAAMTSAANAVADDAADREADPGQCERVQAEHDGARHGRHDVEPGQRRADPDPSAITAVMSTIAR